MTRSRTGSRLSFRRSRSSSVPRVEASESPQEKRKFQVRGKADPSKAINEAEPAAVATSQATTAIPLRNIEFRDQDGNIIVDPDKSNPSRPRLERPLDTIRSFEAAIDGSYYRRQSFRTETPTPINAQARRSSYLNGNYSQRRGISEGGGHHSDRSGAGRPDSYYDNGTAPSAAYYGGSNRRFGPRNNSDPALYGNQPNHAAPNAPYTSHGHQQSYDTVGTTSNGSHWTEPWGNSTNPSSENSSIDRIQPGPKADLGETYGLTGFANGPQFDGPILEEYGPSQPTYGQPAHQEAYTGPNESYAPFNQRAPPAVPAHGPPRPPPKDSLPPKAHAKYGGMGNLARQKDMSGPSRVNEPNEKRKSWLKKRFSRS